MSGIQYWPAASTPGAPANANVSYEALGFGTDGAGTLVSANAATNTKGAASATLGTTAAAWTGLILYCGQISAANQRWLIDVSFDGGSSWAIQNVYMALTSVAQLGLALKIPIIVPAGSDLRVRGQSSTGNATMRAAIEGVVGGSTNAPGFTTFTSLLADTANTRPSTINVPLDDDGSSGWTTLVSPTSATYGAILATVDGNGTAFGTSQPATVMLATGAAAAEVEFARWLTSFSTATLTSSRGWASPIEKSIPSGSRISAQVRAATPGTDNARIALYALN